MLKRALLVFLVLLTLPVVAQDEAPAAKRVRAQGYPLTAALGQGWESYPGDPKNAGEVLFLQTADGNDLDATVSFSAFPMPKEWDSILRRETFQLVVAMDAPVEVNQPLTLGGAKGHKWVYRAVSKTGEQQLHYRLYLALPASVGKNRLLVMQATAPAAQAATATGIFNDLARSLAW